jgi:hypothetical protein
LQIGEWLALPDSSAQRIAALECRATGFPSEQVYNLVFTHIQTAIWIGEGVSAKWAVACDFVMASSNIRPKRAEQAAEPAEPIGFTPSGFGSMDLRVVRFEPATATSQQRRVRNPFNHCVTCDSVSTRAPISFRYLPIKHRDLVQFPHISAYTAGNVVMCLSTHLTRRQVGLLQPNFDDEGVST